MKKRTKKIGLLVLYKFEWFAFHHNYPLIKYVYYRIENNISY